MLIPVVSLYAYENPPQLRSQMILSGVAIVTGASGGFGSEMAAGIASHGLDIIIPCRPGHELRCSNTTSQLWASRGVPAERRFFIESVDLSSSKSVQAFIERVRKLYSGQIRVLVNNAAVGTWPGSSQVLTDDGLDSRFAVNVWAYWALIHGMMPEFQSIGAPCSIVNVASDNAGDLDMADLQFTARPYEHPKPYRQTKALERVLTWEFAGRLNSLDKGRVVINAVHPGVSAAGQTHFEQGHANALKDYYCGQLHMCCDSRSAADRAVWLAVRAPAAGLSGTWWQMQLMPTASRPFLRASPGPDCQSNSVRHPDFDFNRLELRKALWSYLEELDEKFTPSVQRVL